MLATATARTYHQTLGSGAWSGQFIILPCPSVLPFGDNRPQITCATTATHTGHKGWGRERGERKLDLRGGGGPETRDCEMRARKAATEQRNKRQQAAEQQLNAKKKQRNRCPKEGAARAAKNTKNKFNLTPHFNHKRKQNQNVSEKFCD